MPQCEAVGEDSLDLEFAEERNRQNTLFGIEDVIEMLDQEVSVYDKN